MLKFHASRSLGLVVKIAKMAKIEVGTCGTLKFGPHECGGGLRPGPHCATPISGDMGGTPHTVEDSPHHDAPRLRTASPARVILTHCAKGTQGHSRTRMLQHPVKSPHLTYEAVPTSESERAGETSGPAAASAMPCSISFSSCSPLVLLIHS